MFFYGVFGMPLAMLALPIYVYVPQFYAQRGGLTLAVIGAALLAARTAAAFVDPLLGWWITRSGGAYPRFVLIALPLLLAGYAALFHPPVLAGGLALGWFLGALMLVYTGFSLATIAHQSWGAALTQQPGERARVAAVRESCGLLGVMTAAAVPAVFGYDVLSVTFAVVLLAAAALLLRKAPRPPRAFATPAAHAAAAAAAAARVVAGPAAVAAAHADADANAADHAAAGVRLGFSAALAPFSQRRFRVLFLVLMINGVAASIPATLFLFFAEDRLKLGANAGLFLLAYFASAAASMAAWPAIAQRVGEARAWAGSMLLTAVVFIWAWGLGPGDAISYAIICLLSGLALGADLALPPALLAGVIARAGDSGQREAAYFGVWNWGVQMTLALAAGVVLPTLEWLGYVPGTGQGLGALSFAYALLPCCLKLLAAALLWRAPLRDC
ncbi:MFS transporter [Duganella aceris]|uniref:Sodium:galactoside symporter n=1 Tax=Duganella aceris TaxID=2703883 RepID=A0ABX0FMC8_9BURK|nr:MFS transporter [Duganella aceris]NGZ85766.1 sodium:galactoside symporter [Duganella aceris]